ncbi:MAG: histone deacetylase family protein, partial [Candidatus Limnocylindrales bacterium]
MHVVHSERHAAHVFPHEIAAGVPIPAYEVPARAGVILAALGGPGHSIGAPTEHGLGPVEAVHDQRLVRYLETAWAEWEAAGFGPGPIIPDTLLHGGYRAGMGVAPEPRHPGGRVGYWCFDTATPIVAGTYDAARAAADVSLTVADLVIGGATAAYGLCRPPGHHAAREMFGGYCYFNNAAIAAEALRTATGSRIGILDVDFHHGNGSQAIFYDRADVAYASLHGDPMRIYPYFSGHASERGVGVGEGATYNQPLPAATSDAEYLVALERALDWLTDATDGPIVVSLGFDTHERDPICDFSITTAA